LEDLGTDGKIVLNCIFKKWGRDVDWIGLAQDKDMRSAVVNAVMNIRVPQNGGNFLTGCGTVSFLWRRQLRADNNNNNNKKKKKKKKKKKPDIIIRGNEKRTCMLIDVAIPGDRNVINKEAEKIMKYK
jgi:hypothetical protein